MKNLRTRVTTMLKGEQGLLRAYGLVLLLLAAIILGTALVRRETQSPFYNGNVYYWLFTRWEPYACGAWTGFMLVLAMMAPKDVGQANLPDGGDERDEGKDASVGADVGDSVDAANFANAGDLGNKADLVDRAVPKLPLWGMAGVIVAVGITGWFWILQAYPLSMDEVMAQFQATIFARGSICAPVPKEHADVAWALTPVLCTLRPDGGPYGSWVSTYLPGWSAMLSPFQVLGAGWLLNPILSALCLPVLLAVGNRIWGSCAPESRLAVLLLACSPQFLANAMTAYAMPAHLLLALVWIWLMLRRDWLGWAAAPWVGFAAIVLHQPHVHPLLAAPFLLRLVRERRWAVVAYMTAAYAVQVPVVVALTEYFHPGQFLGTSGAPLGPSWLQLFLQPMNVLVLITWGNAPLVLLTLAALLGGELFEEEVQTPGACALRDTAMACVLTFGFYFIMPATQGHGWGYRYFHPALGCWCLVTAAGLRPACALWGNAPARRLILAGCVYALAVLLPLRCVEMFTFTRPFAQGYAFLCHDSLRVSDPYIATPLNCWYGQDFQRNDPFLRNRPLFLFATRLGKSQADALRTANHLDDVEPGDIRQAGLQLIRQIWYP